MEHLYRMEVGLPKQRLMGILGCVLGYDNRITFSITKDSFLQDQMRPQHTTNSDMGGEVPPQRRIQVSSVRFSEYRTK